MTKVSTSAQKITDVQSGATVLVNDNRFTTSENEVKASFKKLNNDQTKMHLQIKGKFVWLPVENFISVVTAPAAAVTEETQGMEVGSAWIDELIAEESQKEEAQETQADAPAIASGEAETLTEAAETAVEAPKKAKSSKTTKKQLVASISDAAEEEKAPEAEAPKAKKVKAEKTETKVVRLKPLSSVEKQIVYFMQQAANKALEQSLEADTTVTVPDIAAGIGKAAAAISGNIEKLVKSTLIAQNDNGVILLPVAAAMTFEPGEIKEVKKAKEPKAKVEKAPKAEKELKRLKVLELLEQGKTDKEVAEAVGCNVEYVKYSRLFVERKKAIETGIKIPTTANEGSKKHLVISLYDAGKTSAEIIKETKADPTYVYDLNGFTLVQPS